ncbi:MAG: hypothetical protein KAU50_11425 [Candidatus Marinimicrobia bacterium]|nr:hypothetical protein [Candidatus Neomarinimicrobiota bacterium]
MNWILLFLTALACGNLWRMGGDGQKWARALVLPAIIALAKLSTIGYWPISSNWVVLAYMPALWALLSLFSYGIDAPPHKFWVWVFGTGSSGDDPRVEMCTRGTCGFFWSLAALPFAFVTGSWAAMVGYALFMTFANAFIGGTVKDVETSERLVGACVTLALLV